MTINPGESLTPGETLGRVKQARARARAITAGLSLLLEDHVADMGMTWPPAVGEAVRDLESRLVPASAALDALLAAVFAARRDRPPQS